MLKVLDLFSGIGGFSLGLERTGGFETVAFCEIEEFPRKVLAKHWPEVPCYHDVRDLTADTLRRDGIAVDVITGGFPCQDISVAGKQAGINSETRSGLWSEIARLIGELRPKFVIVENVANLLSGPSEKRGGWFGRVLGDLAELRYNAEWSSIPAQFAGSPQERERIWIVAYPDRERSPGLRGRDYIHKKTNQGRSKSRVQISEKSDDGLGRADVVANAGELSRVVDGLPKKLDEDFVNGQAKKGRSPQILPLLQKSFAQETVHNWPFGGSWAFLETEILREVMPGKGASQPWGDPQTNDDGEGQEVQDGKLSSLWNNQAAAHSSLRCQHPQQLPLKSNDPVCRVPQSSSRRTDRIKACGNAVIPQIPEMIGNAILEVAV